MLKANYCLPLLCLLSFSVFPQKATFQLYTTEDGLSRNTIWGINQDRQGFLWLATGAGFDRFDGQHFLNHTNSDDPVFSKIRQPGGIAAKGDHLFYFENNQIVILNTITGNEISHFVSDYIPEKDADWFGVTRKLPNGEIATIISNEDGMISYVIRMNGINVHSVKVLPDHRAGNIYTDFVGDEYGNIIYITHKSFRRISPEGKIIQDIPHEHEPMGAMMVARKDNSVFVNYKDQLMSMDENAVEFRSPLVARHLEGQSINHMLETPEKDLWISSNDGNLFFYDTSEDQLHNFKSQLNKIFQNPVGLRTIFQDASGTIWVETVLGLLKVVPRQPLFETYYTEKHKICEGHCSFRGFTEDEKGNIYASFYSFICKLDHQEKENLKSLSRHEHTPFDMVFHKGQIILNDGYLLDFNTGEKYNPYNSIAYSFDIGIFDKDNLGRIWWAWGDQLFFLEESGKNASWKKVNYENKEGNISSMRIDPVRKLLWLGKQQSLMALNLTTREIELEENLEKQSLIGCHYIHLDDKGEIWIGTEKGLGRYHPSDKDWKIYTQEDGLPNEFVHGILPEGDSCLWLATNNGLSRFCLASETFINFHKEDGLPDNEFNRGSSFKASDGRFYFGGMRGIAAFYPEEVMAKYEHQQVKGKLLLHSIAMTDSERDTILTDYFHTDEPEFDVYYHNKTVSLEFGLLEYQNTGKTQYSYVLDGVEKTWSNPSINNTVTFSGLPSGKYVFRVKALNAKGQWVPDELAIRLVVHPPFWATWWAYSFYTLIIAGLVFAVFSFLKKRWKLKNQLQNEQQEALRLKELDTFKSRLYTNLTHEFRTPLTVILGMTDQLAVGTWQSAVRNGERQRLKDGFRLISRNGQNLLQLINQLLDLSKLEDGSLKLNSQYGDIVPFIRYLTKSFKSYAEGKQLSLNFNSEIEKLEMDFDPEQLQQVMTNLLSNAIKFTPSGGNIEVKIEQTAEGASSTVYRMQSATITISDTGIGISKEDLPHIFDRFYQVDGTTTRTGEGTGIGLAHSLELVRLMDGQIEVVSELGKGTTFQVSIPIKKGESTPAFSFEKNSTSTLPSIEDLNSVFEKNVFTSNEQNDLPQLLIIEDNPDLVIYLKSCLENHYALQVAKNGRIGIEKAIERIPDLILSDIMMPEKDGFAVVDFLKNDERTSHIPITLLTAKADISSKIIGLKRGADAYLSKPFHKEELLATLAMMMENSRRIKEHFSNINPPSLQPSALQQATLEEVVNEVQVAIQQEDAFLQKLRSILENHHSDENFALPQLSEILGMTRYQLFRKMKAVAAESPSSFIRSFRMKKAKQYLEKTDMNVSEVAWQVGFKDLSHFSKTFQEYHGMPPSEMKK